MENRAQANGTQSSLLPSLQGSGKKLSPFILYKHHLLSDFIEH
jgi:hypothetical protein